MDFCALFGKEGSGIRSQGPGSRNQILEITLKKIMKRLLKRLNQFFLKPDP